MLQSIEYFLCNIRIRETERLLQDNSIAGQSCGGYREGVCSEEERVFKVENNFRGKKRALLLIEEVMCLHELTCLELSC